MKTNCVPLKYKPFPFLTKVIALVISFVLLFEQSGFAQVAEQLDISNRFNQLASVLSLEKSRTLHFRYLAYDRINNSLKVILDKGGSKNISNKLINNSLQRSLEYFFIGVALPNENFWVNLKPDSENNIMDDQLVKTDIGKILLAADLELKKDLAHFTFPASSEGKQYWDKIYDEMNKQYGLEIPTVHINTRIWITPGEVVVCENAFGAYIYKATLNVLVEDDYLKNKNESLEKDERAVAVNKYSTDLMRKLILPKIVNEVNTAKKYASLRQVYYSLILAQWFKKKMYGQGGLYSYLINKKNLKGITSKEYWSKDQYFKEYQRSYKEKEYDLKVKVFNLFGQAVRTYSSGGVDFTGILSNPVSQAVKIISTDNLKPPLTENTTLLDVDTSRCNVSQPYSVGSFPDQAEEAGKESPLAEDKAEVATNQRFSLNNFILKVLFSPVVSKPLSWIAKMIASLPKPVRRLMVVFPIVGVLLAAFPTTAYAFNIDADSVNGNIKDLTFTFQSWHKSPDPANETLSGMGQVIGQAHGLNGQALTDFIYHQFIPAMEPILKDQGISNINVIADGQQIKIPADFLNGLTPDGLKDVVHSLGNNGWSPLNLDLNVLPSHPVVTPGASSTAPAIPKSQSNNDFFTNAMNWVQHNQTALIIIGCSVLVVAILIFFGRAIYNKVRKAKQAKAENIIQSPIGERSNDILEDYARARREIENIKRNLENLESNINICKSKIKELLVERKKYPDNPVSEDAQHVSLINDSQRIFRGYLDNYFKEQKRLREELLAAQNRLEKIKKDMVALGVSLPQDEIPSSKIADNYPGETQRINQVQVYQGGSQPPLVRIRLKERLERAEEDYVREKKAIEKIEVEIKTLDALINKRQKDIVRLIAAKKRYEEDGRIAYARTVDRIIGSCLINLLDKRKTQQDLLKIASTKLLIIQNRLEKIKKNIAAYSMVPPNASSNGLEAPANTDSIGQEDLLKLKNLEANIDADTTLDQIYTILKALMNYEYTSDYYKSARQIIRHIKPTNFVELRKIASTVKPFANNVYLQKVLDSIAVERPSDLQVGISRTLARIHDWEAKLKQENLTETDIAELVEYCEKIYHVLPLRLTQETSDTIGPIYKNMESVHKLIQRTIDHLLGQKMMDKEKYAGNVEKLFKWGHYFSDYIGALSYLSGLNIAKGYIVNIEKASSDNGNKGNGRANFKIKYGLWHQISAVPYIAGNAKKNLNIFLRRINTEGNQRSPEEHYKRLNPTRIGPTTSWLLRKPITLFISFFWVAFNLIVNISTGFNFGSASRTMVGFLLVPLLHYGFAMIGEHNTKKDIVRFHRSITVLEKKWKAYLPLNNPVVYQKLNNNLAKEDYALEGKKVTRQDVEAIAGLAKALGIKPVKIAGVKEELSKLFGPGKFSQPDFIIMPEAQMLTLNYRKINGPIRLGDRIFMGDQYFAQHKNDFLAILADFVHEQMAGWVAQERPDIDADVAHELAGEAGRIVKVNQNSYPSSADNTRVKSPGGIDFRNINFAVRSSGQVMKNDKQLVSDRLGVSDDYGVVEINNLLKARIIPSVERLKEYLEKSSNQTDCLEQVNNWLAESFRLEEEYLTATDSSLIAMLQLVASKSVNQFNNLPQRN
ncbi:MAG: hypothetical protein WCY09_06485 [Candidatus Omnitrophota bacterium]